MLFGTYQAILFKKKLYTLPEEEEKNGPSKISNENKKPT